MTNFFVTGTGTDIGKTFISTALLRHWHSAGRRCTALKPVLSGFDKDRPEESDAGQLLTALGQPATPDALDAISPWRFTAPLSPDMAAAREDRVIVLDELLDFCRQQIERHVVADVLLIEGVGGVMAPLNNHATILDWMAALGMPILLVAGSYLGTLSHTLTALTTLAARGLNPVAVIINESPQSPVPVEETAATLARHWPGLKLCVLSRNPSPNEIAALAAYLMRP